MSNIFNQIFYLLHPIVLHPAWISNLYTLPHFGALRSVCTWPAAVGCLYDEFQEPLPWLLHGHLLWKNTTMMMNFVLHVKIVWLGSQHAHQTAVYLHDFERFCENWNLDSLAKMIDIHVGSIPLATRICSVIQISTICNFLVSPCDSSRALHPIVGTKFDCLVPTGGPTTPSSSSKGLPS